MSSVCLFSGGHCVVYVGKGLTGDAVGRCGGSVLCCVHVGSGLTGDCSGVCVLGGGHYAVCRGGGRERQVKQLRNGMYML